MTLKNSLTKIGIVVTIVYVILLVLALCFLCLSKEFNEWGDFLAGGFAPLAFFWLILGFCQQREELRQNSKSIRLQARELRESVRESRVANRRERSRAILGARPFFSQTMRSSELDYSYWDTEAVRFEIQNLGAPVVVMDAKLEDDDGVNVDTRIPSDDPSGEDESWFWCESPRGVALDKGESFWIGIRPSKLQLNVGQNLKLSMLSSYEEGMILLRIDQGTRDSSEQAWLTLQMIDESWRVRDDVSI